MSNERQITAYKAVITSIVILFVMLGAQFLEVQHQGQIHSVGCHGNEMPCPVCLTLEQAQANIKTILSGVAFVFKAIIMVLVTLTAHVYVINASTSTLITQKIRLNN